MGSLVSVNLMLQLHNNKSYTNNFLKGKEIIRFYLSTSSCNYVVCETEENCFFTCYLLHSQDKQIYIEMRVIQMENKQINWIRSRKSIENLRRFIALIESKQLKHFALQIATFLKQ